MLVLCEWIWDEVLCSYEAEGTVEEVHESFVEGDAVLVANETCLIAVLGGVGWRVLKIGCGFAWA